MEKEELREQLQHCPLRVRMSDGRDYLIEKPEFVMLGDYTAAVLYRRDDGKLLNGVMTLMNITMVEPVEGSGLEPRGGSNGSPRQDS